MMYGLGVLRVNKLDGVYWLSQEEYEKSVGQLRLQLGAIFAPFNMYGMGDLIPSAIEEAVKLCEDFGLRVRGIDKPLSVDMIRRSKKCKSTG